MCTISVNATATNKEWLRYSILIMGIKYAALPGGSWYLEKMNKPGGSYKLIPIIYMV